MEKITKSLKKMTLFDKAIIFLAILGTLFFVYVFFRKSNYITVVVKVGEEEIRYLPWFAETGSRVWFSELFYEGMKEKDGLGRTNVEVLSVYSYNTTPETKAVYLTLKLKGVFSRAQNQHTYKGNPVLIGHPIKIFLDSLLVEGLVTQMEGIQDPRKKQDLTVQVKIVEENPTFPESSGVDEHVAEAIKVGDEIMDNNGETIIKIVEKRVENAKKVVTTSDGRVILQTQPLRKDVYLTLYIKAIKISDRYFVFDDEPILIGLTIPLNFSSYTLWPEVTSIKVN